MCLLIFVSWTNVQDVYNCLAAQAPWNTSATVTPLMMNIEYLDSPTMSKMVPFAGNLVALHTMEGEPFIANYVVVADVLQPETVNDLDSAIAIATSTA